MFDQRARVKNAPGGGGVSSMLSRNSRSQKAVIQSDQCSLHWLSDRKPDEQNLIGFDCPHGMKINYTGLSPEEKNS